MADSLPKLPVFPWYRHEDLLPKDHKHDNASSDLTIERGSAPECNPSYILHSTGSSANPKAIPIMARAVLNFACLRGHYDSWLAITSLAHGYSNFHAGMTLARGVPIYLASSMTINGENLVKALRASQGRAQVFLAVPAFLDYLFAHPEGPHAMKTLVSQVHVTGGPMSSKNGVLVEQHDIKMQYFVASTEAGLYLCSGSAKSTDWAWLSIYSIAQPYIKMELFDEETGGSEVVVKKGFPDLQVSNRSNGDFATGDMFLPGQMQSINEGKWKFWRRKDEVLVHSSGLKSDPVASKLLEVVVRVKAWTELQFL